MYLVSIEGYEQQIFETEDEVHDFLHAVAQEMRDRGVDCVNTWADEMFTYNSSNLYNRYPDIVIFLSSKTLSKLKK